MNRPIGHFTSYTPGDGSLLESLQEEYGSGFEKMSRREKLFLIAAIAIQSCDQANGRCRDEIYVVGHQINSSLPLEDKEGLIQALIHQVRWGRSLSDTQEVLPMK
ncbi:MAG: hypothetical protein V7L00_17815 [Nostoc sp.]|uniref:hypothetical protein n=1 Tax=Nostoc sp. TaxID=1180 RepID=UPI002FFA990E